MQDNGREQFRFTKGLFQAVKSKEQFQEFFQEMFKQRVNEMLQGDFDECRGFEKHAPEDRGSGNSRNGFSGKKVKNEALGDVVLSIPRDRNASFEPKLIPKHQSISDQIEQNVIGLYSKGMSTRILKIGFGKCRD